MQPLLERAVSDIEQHYTDLIEYEMKSYQKGCGSMGRGWFGKRAQGFIHPWVLE